MHIIGKQLSIAATVLGAIGAAHAQEDPSPDIPVPIADQQAAIPDHGAERIRSRMIEEIIVTAQKREENLQDVPISVQAFSADMLDAKGISDAQGLQKVTPGLVIGDQAGYAVMYLRGVGSDVFVLGDPSVALYVDGVVFPALAGAIQSFGGVERIEVLKGPQGTLFGRNSTGGAINVVTRDPDFDPAGSVQASYGNYDSFQTRASINVPLGEQFAFNVSAFWNHEDSYYRLSPNSILPPLPTETSKGYRIKLRWQPLDELDLVASVTNSRDRGARSLAAANTYPRGIWNTVIQPAPAFEATGDAPPFYFIENTVAYGQVKWQAPWFDVKLLGSHQNLMNGQRLDFDGSPLPIASFESFNQFAKADSAELQFLSSDASWLSDRLQWIVGLYYLTTEKGLDPVTLNVAGLNVDNEGILPTALQELLSARLIQQFGGGLPLPFGVNASIRGVIELETYAAYFQSSWKFTDWMSATIGGRYQTEKRRVIESSLNLRAADGGLAEILDWGKPRRDEQNFSPKASLDFRPWEDTLIYLSYSLGYKSGTYNVINVYNPPESIEPEKVFAYELGIKADFLDHLLRVNAAVFQTKIEDLQVQFISLTNGGALSFENAANARIRGAEIDATAQLLPSLSDGLVFTFSASYLDAIYTDYERASGFVPGLGLFLPHTFDYTGNRIARTPKWSGTAGLSQTFAAPGGEIEISGDVYYNSGFHYLADDDDPVSRQKAYHTVNARVSYLYAPWDVRVTAFGQNITDELYAYSHFHSDFGRLEYLAPKATYGVRINWEF